MGDMFNRLKDKNCLCEAGNPNDQCPIHGYEAWKKQQLLIMLSNTDTVEDCPRCNGDPDGVCHHEDMIPYDEAGEASMDDRHRYG